MQGVVVPRVFKASFPAFGAKVDSHELTVYGPPEPAPNFTYKLKIFLGFVQIVTAMGAGK
jgi:hypothetical protein